MKKIFFVFIMLFLFLNCVGLYKIDNYRIKLIENNYNYISDYPKNKIFLTKTIGEDKWEKGRVTLNIEFNTIEHDDNNNLLISSFKEDFIIGGKKYISGEKYEKPEILNDVIITKKDGKKIVIAKNKIRYTYKEDPNTDFKKAVIYIPEVLSGPIVLELGKIKIADTVYDTPKIYMQKYRVTESYSVLGSLLEEGGAHLPGYHSEGWIDN